jgi:hypothetical protein
MPRLRHKERHRQPLVSGPLQPRRLIELADSGSAYRGSNPWGQPMNTRVRGQQPQITICGVRTMALVVQSQLRRHYHRGCTVDLGTDYGEPVGLRRI